MVHRRAQCFLKWKKTYSLSIFWRMQSLICNWTCKHKAQVWLIMYAIRIRITSEWRKEAENESNDKVISYHSVFSYSWTFSSASWMFDVFEFGKVSFGLFTFLASLRHRRASFGVRKGKMRWRVATTDLSWLFPTKGKGGVTELLCGPPKRPNCGNCLKFWLIVRKRWSPSNQEEPPI